MIQKELVESGAGWHWNQVLCFLCSRWDGGSWSMSVEAHRGRLLYTGSFGASAQKQPMKWWKALCGMSQLCVREAVGCVCVPRGRWFPSATASLAVQPHSGTAGCSMGCCSSTVPVLAAVPRAAFGCTVMGMWMHWSLCMPEPVWMCQCSSWMSIDTKLFHTKLVSLLSCLKWITNTK